MDFKSTIDLIIKDLNEASEIIDDLKKYPGVPALQVEFAKSKCKSAAEVIALLKNLEDTIRPAAQPVQHKPEVIQPSEVIEIEEEPEVIEKPVVEDIKPKESRPAAADVKPKEPKPPVAPVKEKPVRKTPEKNETSVADKFTHKTDFYEETLSTKAERDLSEKLKIKPITSLSDAIGLNDRFLFTSEIFHGDKNAYAQAISRLDMAQNLQDAMAIIMSYTGDNTENEAVIQLLDLVRLKLPADE